MKLTGALQIDGFGSVAFELEPQSERGRYLIRLRAGLATEQPDVTWLGAFVFGWLLVIDGWQWVEPHEVLGVGTMPIGPFSNNPSIETLITMAILQWQESRSEQTRKVG